MERLLIIPGRLPGMNEYTSAQRTNPYKGAEMKKRAQRDIEMLARSQLRDVTFKMSVRLRYEFYEPNKRRDHDNVSGFAHKVIQDALVQAGVLTDDGWDEIIGYSDDFALDKRNPRIVVHIEEIMDE